MPGEPRPAELAAVAALALAGQGATAGLTVALYFLMSPDGFATYAQCAALFLLAKTVAPFGMDRLALQVLPGLEGTAGASAVAGFWRLALRRTALGTVLGMAGMLAVGWTWGNPWSVVLTALGLPLAAVAHMLAVQAIVQGRPALAALATRMVPVLTVLCILAGLVVLGRSVEPVHLLLAWGAGWVAAATLLWCRGAVVMWHGPTAPAVPQMAHAGGFVIQSLTLAAMRRAPVILSGYLAPPSEVATLVLSFALADFASFLAPLVDGPFLRHAGELASRGEDREGRRIFTRRNRAFGMLVAIPMAIMVASAPLTLGRWLPDAVWQDLVAVAAVAVGTTMLAFSGFSRKMLVSDMDQGWKLRLLAVWAALEIALLLAAIPLAGATGAATAFAVSATAVAARITFRAARASIGS